MVFGIIIIKTQGGEKKVGMFFSKTMAPNQHYFWHSFMHFVKKKVVKSGNCGLIKLIMYMLRGERARGGKNQQVWTCFSCLFTLASAVCLHSASAV